MTNSCQDVSQQTPSSTREKINLIKGAREVLNGERSLTIKALEKKYKQLEHYSQFAYATEALLVKMFVGYKRDGCLSVLA